MPTPEIALLPLAFSYAKGSGGERLTEPTGFQSEGSSRSGVVGEEAESSPYGWVGVVIDLSPFLLCNSTHLPNEGPVVDLATEIAAGSAYLALIYQSSASSLSSSALPRSQLWPLLVRGSLPSSKRRSQDVWPIELGSGADTLFMDRIFPDLTQIGG
ncbi:hypothetical protein U1Q18_000524 [Sarracenia purpurea var. burkii]